MVGRPYTYYSVYKFHNVLVLRCKKYIVLLCAKKASSIDALFAEHLLFAVSEIHVLLSISFGVKDRSIASASVSALGCRNMGLQPRCMTYQLFSFFFFCLN